MSERSIGFVQGLRGIAALAVVLWHASRYLGPYGTGAGGALFAPGAAMGVDLFFLISGFIMFHTTRRSDGSTAAFADFAIKRVTRIWPLWIIALAVQIAHRWDPALLADPVKRIWLVHSLFLLPTAGAPADVPPVYGSPFLGVGWTLNYEMYFYAFFGAAMLFGRWRWAAFSAWLIATLLVIPIVTGKLGVANIGEILTPNNSYAYDIRYIGLITNPMILLFVAGVVLGWIYHSRFAIADTRVLAVLVALAVAGAVCQYAMHYRVTHGLIAWGLSLVPLLFALLMFNKQRVMQWPRALTYLGDISFSLYLFHPVVQESFDPLARRFLPAMATGYAAIAATTIIAILVAALSHRYLERGLCDALRRRVHRAILGGDAAQAALPRTT